MEEMVPVLRSLKCATTALCGGVSSSMIYPVTATLLTKHLPVAPEESKKVAEYKQTVSVSLKRRLKRRLKPTKWRVPRKFPTSVPSERVFSAAGLILNRLHPDHVDLLIFLNKN
ncbi:Zinc finger BED domain containing protein 1 [Dissostichus eleginoides]|uniref:Zinc finger BED domain containing protein 1 n=1 Tax=Dissostichus eleginoides TaxID=100907 RepID=A0AAD9FH14_DISEL|nr:Zinc finger BED domain containing protein 1 [Dissostichus eleginoides]